MKFLMFILALYVLILPFAGSVSCDELAHTEATIASGVQHPEDYEESCTPFCNCSCCFHVASYHFELQKIAALKACFTEKKFSSYYTEFYPSGILKNIWQPPKA